MHRCLQIPEIMLEVLQWMPVSLSKDCSGRGCSCDFVSSEDFPPEFMQRRDALAVALTCKAFLNPGLDALWYHMHSIAPLVACLPSIPPEEVRSEETLAQVVESSIIRGLESYARRIQILCVSEDDVPSISFRLLSYCAAEIRHPLFPRLRQLIWKHTRMETFRYLTQFAGESIQSIRLFPFPWDSTLDEKVRSIVAKFASLSESLFEIYIDDQYTWYPYGHQDCYGKTALFLSALPSIEAVTIENSVSKNVLNHLASLRDLDFLCLSFKASKPISPPASQIVPAQIDLTMEDMILQNAELDDFIALFQSFRFPNLQCLEIMPDHCFPAHSIGRLIHAICEACSLETLTEFNVFGTDDHTHNICTPYTLDGATLTPLFKFRNMTDFTFSACTPQWDDKLLEDLASAWPNLGYLYLRAHKGHPSNFTIAGLHSLAKHCPILNQICLELAPWDGNIGALRRRDWDALSSAPPLKIALRYYHRPELEPEAKSYIQEIFPNLEEITVNKFADEDSWC